MAESGSVPGKGRIGAIIEKLSRRASENGRLCVSTENGRIRASTGKVSNLFDYRKMVESGRLPGKGRIRASLEKLPRRVQEKGRIYVSTEKW